MAKSYVIIELDTTPPKINIYAPKYVTKDMKVEIIVESDKKIIPKEIYIVDSRGIKREYTFSIEDYNKLIGILSFHDYPFGLSTIYVRVEDEVGNVSNIKSFTLEVKKTLSNMELKIDDYSRNIHTNLDIMNIDANDLSAIIKDNNYNKQKEIVDRNVEIQMLNRNMLIESEMK